MLFSQNLTKPIPFLIACHVEPEIVFDLSNGVCMLILSCSKVFKEQLKGSRCGAHRFPHGSTVNVDVADGIHH